MARRRNEGTAILPDDDLARVLVNVAYDPRIADDRARLEETARAVVDIGGCERVSLLAWAQNSSLSDYGTIL